MGEELTIEILRQLPLATVAILACIGLWRAFREATKEHISDLRQDKKDAEEMRVRELADLRARTMVVEDHLHIKRSDRIQYLPDTKFPGGGEMKDFDLDG